MYEILLLTLRYPEPGMILIFELLYSAPIVREMGDTSRQFSLYLISTYLNLWRWMTLALKKLVHANANGNSSPSSIQDQLHFALGHLLEDDPHSDGIGSF